MGDEGPPEPGAGSYCGGGEASSLNMVMEVWLQLNV